MPNYAATVALPPEKASKIIRRITDADLPLELVDKKLLGPYENTRGHVHVSESQIRAARNPLFSDSFFNCQGLCFLDEVGLGALAHVYPTVNRKTLRRDMLDVGVQEYIVHKYRDIAKVKAFHVYCSEDEKHHPFELMAELLREIGVTDVICMAIKPKNSDKSQYWRDIVLDPRKRTVYVFPADFDYGIAYNMKK